MYHHVRKRMNTVETDNPSLRFGNLLVMPLGGANNDLALTHRHDANDSYDSICRRCLTTVGTSAREIDLRALESRHVCDPMNVYLTSQGYAPRRPAMHGTSS